MPPIDIRPLQASPAVIAMLIIPPLLSKSAVKQISYKTFLQQYVEKKQVASACWERRPAANPKSASGWRVCARR